MKSFSSFFVGMLAGVLFTLAINTTLDMVRPSINLSEPAGQKQTAERPSRADRRIGESQELSEARKRLADVVEAAEKIATEANEELAKARSEIRRLKPQFAPELPQSQGVKALDKWKEATTVFADGSWAIVGAADEAVDLGGGIRLQGRDGRSIFVARFKSDGTPEWAFASGNALGGEERAQAIAALPDGSCIVVGAYNAGGAEFKDFADTFDTRQSNGGADCFAMKYNRDGKILWLTTFGGPGNDDTAYGVAALSDGGCTIVGRFGESVQFGNKLITADSTQNGFVARLSDMGEFVWVTSIPLKTPGVNGAATAVCSLPDDSVIVAGQFYGRSFFNEGTPDEIKLQGVGGDDVFVARFSPTGFVQWAKAAGGKQRDSVASVDLNSAGSTCSVTGDFSGGGAFWLGEDGLVLSSSKGGLLPFVATVATEDGALKSAQRRDK